MNNSNDQYDNSASQSSDEESVDLGSAELELNESEFHDAVGMTADEEVAQEQGEDDAGSTLEGDEASSSSFDFEAFLEKSVQDAEADRSMRELWSSLTNEDSAVLDKPVGADAGDEVEDWGMIGWGIEVSRDEEGKTLKGKEAREDPASLVIYGADGENIASILLTPAVQAQMQKALTKVGKMYEDPVKPKEAASDTLEKVVNWHKEHKVMGAVSALFIVAFVALTIIGFFVVT